MKLNVFVSSTKDGIMSNDKKYFPKLTKEEREMLYESTLTRFLSKRNIDRNNIIIINDKNTKHSAHTVTNENKNLKDKVILLKDKTPNLVVAVETSDEPIIMASAKNEQNESTCVVAKASIKNLNEDLLTLMVDTLMKETDAPPFEMTFYIGACPSKENFILDSVEELTSPIWKDTYEKKKKKYHLDLRYAIFNQLMKEIVDPNYIYFDSNDTTEEENYFSDISDKKGRHLECVVYTDEEV